MTRYATDITTIPMIAWVTVPRAASSFFWSPEEKRKLNPPTKSMIKRATAPRETTAVMALVMSGTRHSIEATPSAPVMPNPFEHASAFIYVDYDGCTRKTQYGFGKLMEPPMIWTPKKFWTSVMIAQAAPTM